MDHTQRKPHDLNELERQETATHEFTHPVTGEPLGWIITIYGPASDEHAAAAERLRKRKINLTRRHKREEDIPAEATWASWCEFLADVTVRIDGLTRNGQPVESSRRAVLDLFMDRKHHGPELAAQVVEKLGDLTAFIKA